MAVRRRVPGLDDRFPDTQALATPAVVAKMKQQIMPAILDSRWRKLFPNQIPDVLAVAQPLPGNEIDLEGNKLLIVEGGHTDTDDTTAVHVPSIGLVVGGDAVYNGIHLFLNESTRQNRQAWLAAPDKIAALQPRAVVAGHKLPSNDGNPRCVAETRQYLQDSSVSTMRRKPRAKCTTPTAPIPVRCGAPR